MLTDASGYFSLAVAPGTYDVAVTMPGYLSALRSGVTVAEGNAIELPLLTILGGDADNTRLIDVLDLTTVAASFDTSPPQDIRADLDGNGIVNVFDLALVGMNFSKTGSSWEGTPFTGTAETLQAVKE